MNSNSDELNRLLNQKEREKRSERTGIDKCVLRTVSNNGGNDEYELLFLFKYDLNTFDFDLMKKMIKIYIRQMEYEDSHVLICESFGLLDDFKYPKYKMIKDIQNYDSIQYFAIHNKKKVENIEGIWCDMPDINNQCVIKAIISVSVKR